MFLQISNSHTVYSQLSVRLTCTVSVSALKYAWDELLFVVTVVSEADGAARPLGGGRRVTQRHRHNDQNHTCTLQRQPYEVPQAAPKLVPNLATIWHASNNETKVGTPHSLARIIRRVL